MTNHKQKQVEDFYDGKSIFITGGSGFLGKVIIEKLLYTCPGIEKMFLLLRPKKEVNTERRIKRIFDNPLFARIKEKDPKLLEKVVAISGDVTVSNLGLSQAEEEILIENVSVVIHSAATVKFNLPLREAMNVNLEGTKRVMDICNRMKNIQVFVHISTAYTNVDKCVIDEDVYPTNTSLDQVYRFLQLENKSTDMKSLLGEHPNTYTFTKALTENFIAESHGLLPTVIVRPSIVTPIIQEPQTGWLDNWNGATSLLAAGTKGLLWVMPGESHFLADLIPVDYVANLSIVAAANHPLLLKPSYRRYNSKTLSIYNCCSSAANSITWGQVVELYAKNHKMKYFNFHPVIWFTNNFLVLWVVRIFMQILPAFFFDSYQLLILKNPRFVKIQRQLHDSIKLLGYFTQGSWLMTSAHVQALKSRLTPEDIEKFPFDPSDINWPDYLAKYSKGVDKYLPKR